MPSDEAHVVEESYTHRVLRKDTIECYGEGMTEQYLIRPTNSHGGEGTLYEVLDYPDLVAKVYTPESLERSIPFTRAKVIDGTMVNVSWTMPEKVTYMTAISGQVPTRIDESGDEVLAVAWPQKTLLDVRGRFIGFLMPKVDIQCECNPSLHLAYRPRERKYLFGDSFTWLTSIRIALNLATVVRHLHENDIVIGDFNCNNILIDKDGHVTLIDTDSFCVSNNTRGVSYKCFVGCGEYVAPEMQGVNFAESRRTFTKESDCFSLAIHVFMLLMNGTHPFTGSKSGAQSRQSSSAEPLVHEIQSGDYAYPSEKSRSLPGTPSIDILPYYIQNLLNKTFVYDERTATSEKVIKNRPTAFDWEVALRRLYEECTESDRVCLLHPHEHVSHPDNSTCLWCEMEGNGDSVPLLDSVTVEAMHCNRPRAPFKALFKFMRRVGLVGALVFFLFVNPSIIPYSGHIVTRIIGVLVCLNSLSMMILEPIMLNYYLQFCIYAYVREDAQQDDIDRFLYDASEWEEKSPAILWVAQLSRKHLQKILGVTNAECPKCVMFELTGQDGAAEVMDLIAKSESFARISLSKHPRDSLIISENLRSNL